MRWRSILAKCRPKYWARPPQALLLLAVMVVAFIVYPLWQLADYRRYHVAREVTEVIGEANPDLAEQLEFDAQENQFRFNADALETTPKGDNPEEIAQLMSQQAGGATEDASAQYALDLPIDPDDGTTFHDTNTQTSFRITPQFKKDDGRKDAGRVVYPMQDGGQAIYTAKANGVKEDIVLQAPPGDTMSLSYELELPNTLEARMIEETGELGIYSANPALFGDISFGSADDEEKVRSAREHGKKDNLVFVLPAPTIEQNGGGEHDASAHFVLDGSTLTVEAAGLAALSYPISIDPSIVVTSSSDFSSGNDETNISYEGDAANRAELRSGVVEPWQASSTFTTARDFTRGVAHNGYLYIVGGWTGSSALTSVQYASINGDGSLGAFQAATNLPATREDHAVVAYNNHIYALGGLRSGGTSSSVEYAPINSDGSLGSWASTTSMPTARWGLSANVYNGYIYGIGGSGTNVVEYALLQADGTAGSWSSTTSLPGNRNYHATVVYNDYIYILGGVFSTGNEVAYVRINDDGTIGSWMAQTSFATGRYVPQAAAEGGYLYVMGGISGSTQLDDVQYAPINADGTLGNWHTTNTLVSPRGHAAGAYYDGHLYMMGGHSGSSRLNTTEYTTLRPAGYLEEYATSTAFTGARWGAPSVVYNNRIYLLGGATNYPATTVSGTVRYATLNNDGTIGAWSNGTTLPVGQARYGHTAVAYNDYIYVSGGLTSGGATNNTLYAPINANGSLGSWSTATNNFTDARVYHQSFTYNGFLYVIGGETTGPTYFDDTQYAQLQSGGDVGTWSSTSTLVNARSRGAVVRVGEFVYILGGRDASLIYFTPQFARVNSDGTLGSWGTTTVMSGSRTWLSATAVNGYIYVAGGRSNTGVVLNDTQYAKVNADGTIDSWSGTVNMPVARQGHTMASANGHVYFLAGNDDSTTYNTTYFAQVNNGGQGSTNTWSGVSSFTTARALHGAVAYNGRLYIFGGHSGSAALDNVQYASINDNGTLGSWTATSSMAAARFNFGYTMHNGYIYTLGGYDSGSSPTDTVQYAPINTDGTLGTWQTTSSFTNARGSTAAATSDGHLYILGGFDGSTTRYGDVQFAQTNGDGSLGSWSGTTSFSPGRAAHDAVAYNGYLYVLGGEEHSTLNLLNDVQYAPINGDGTIGAWAPATSFSVPRFGMKVAAANGYLYMTGGNDGTGVMARIEYVPILQSGMLGEWQTSPNSLATARSSHAAALGNGHLYVLGGNETGGARIASVETAAPQMIPRQGQYSRLIDIGQEAELSSIDYLGDLPGHRGSITFRAAGSDGVFGNVQPSTTLPMDDVRYVLVNVSFDDSQRGVFNDATRATVTELSINYKLAVTPEERLRHGAYFFDEILQPLETE